MPAWNYPLWLRHIRLWHGLALLVALAYAAVFALWAVAWSSTGSVLDTFSLALATSAVTRNLALFVLGVFAVFKALTVAYSFVSQIVRNHPRPNGTSEREHRSLELAARAFDAAHGLYIFFSALEVVGLGLVINFPVTTEHDAHMVAACLAYAGAFGASLALFARRVFAYELHEWLLHRYLLWANAFTLLLIVAASAVLWASFDGVTEFVLTLAFLLDMPWEVVDHAREELDLGITLRHKQCLVEGDMAAAAEHLRAARLRRAEQDALGVAVDLRAQRINASLPPAPPRRRAGGPSIATTPLLAPTGKEL